MKDHRIQKVNILEHDNEVGKDAAKIVNQMVLENYNDVDLVSAATILRKAIIKAVENALV